MTSTLLSPDSRTFLRQTSSVRVRLKGRYAHYHQDTVAFFQRLIQNESRVLVIGCDVGSFAAQLRATEVYLLDLDEESIARFVHPTVRKVKDLSVTMATTSFDYVLLPYTLQYLENIQGFLETLRSGLRPQARVIVLGHNFLWAPLIKLAERIGLKIPTPDLNWLSLKDVRNLFDLTCFQTITEGWRCLIPFSIPWISRWINTYVAPLPYVRWACQKYFAVARSLSIYLQLTY